MESRKLPKFKDEAEEARCWYDHRDEIVKAMREGRTGPSSVARLRAKLQAEEAARSERGALTSAGNASQ
jgi:formiminotetrahydrofolate cyclodeaminase